MYNFCYYSFKFQHGLDFESEFPKWTPNRFLGVDILGMASVCQSKMYIGNACACAYKCLRMLGCVCAHVAKVIVIPYERVIYLHILSLCISLCVCVCVCTDVAK